MEWSTRMDVICKELKKLSFEELQYLNKEITNLQLNKTPFGDDLNE